MISKEPSDASIPQNKIPYMCPCEMMDWPGWDRQQWRPVYIRGVGRSLAPKRTTECHWPKGKFIRDISVNWIRRIWRFDCTLCQFHLRFNISRFSVVTYNARTDTDDAEMSIETAFSQNVDTTPCSALCLNNLCKDTNLEIDNKIEI